MNELYYGQKFPPHINLSDIKAPVAMFVGKEDEFGNPPDAEWAKKTIGENVVLFEEFENYDHFTF